MTADHPNTEIISGNCLVAALETESSVAIVQRGSPIVAEGMDGPSGKHYIFAEVDPIFFSFLGAHCYTLKLSIAFRVSG